MLTTSEEKRSRVRMDQAAHPWIQDQPVVLCVDDDPAVPEAIGLRLRPYHVEVRHAFYGTQGIWESVQEHPDLIIMDLAMPNGDGHYAVECIRSNAETASIPIIVLTGMRDERVRRRVLSEGADLFLQKPISGDDLVHHISRFIDLKSKDDPFV